MRLALDRVLHVRLAMHSVIPTLPHVSSHLPDVALLPHVPWYLWVSHVPHVPHLTASTDIPHITHLSYRPLSLPLH